MIRTLARILAASAVAALALAAPAAFAQYSIVAAGTPSGPGTCNFGTATVPVTSGSLTLTLPAGPNNILFTASVNGGPPFTAGESFASGVTVQPRTSFDFEIDPPTLPPYTVVETLMPMSNGVPTGTGVTFTVVCSALGGATLTLVIGVPGGGGGGGPVASSEPIPTMSPPGLVGLALLLGGMALIGIRRRQG
jgi:hypothetical protein